MAQISSDQAWALFVILAVLWAATIFNTLLKLQGLLAHMSAQMSVMITLLSDIKHHRTDTEL
ncbi:MAG: hypothetical protein WBQ53_01885 [Methylocystis sp.]